MSTGIRVAAEKNVDLPVFGLPTIPSFFEYDGALMSIISPVLAEKYSIHYCVVSCKSFVRFLADIFLHQGQLYILNLRQL